MHESFDVMVVGGGVVGLSAALAMLQRGFSVALFDAGDLEAQDQTQGGRVYALNQASQTLLQRLGVWSRLDERQVSSYQSMYVWDALSGAKLEFDARSMAASSLGVMLNEGVLKKALLVTADGVGLTRFSRCVITRVQPHEQGVSIFSDERAWHARLLIVADGPHSALRTLLHVPMTTWPYHQHAVVAQVQTTKPHQQTAYQVFEGKGALAFLPLVDPYQCSIVWSTSAPHASVLMKASDEQFSASLTQAFESRLGRVDVVGRRHEFPLHMRHTSSYVGPSWMLMGDAAHTLHPLAGLGLNVGLADVDAWCRLLDNRPGELNASRLLHAYQRERKYAVWQVIALMQGLKMLFTSPFSGVVATRGWGLNAVNRLTFLKKYLIAQAAG
ncbi:MAG: FAD-dependent oxidoreductase [Legionellaceae bacterium]